MTSNTLKDGRTYLGWYVTYNITRPVTGRWRAVRFGVSVCSGTNDGLKELICRKAGIK